MNKFLFFFTAFAWMLQITFSLDEEDVDRVIADCQNKVKRIQSTEGRYVADELKRGEPALTPPPVPELMPPLYAMQQRQAVFECIGDELKGNSDESLEKYDSYRTLKQNCSSENPITPKCDPAYPYRSINGTCNNINHPKWGSVLSCCLRLFPANYEGVSGIRKSVKEDGRLPEPRTVSLNLVKPRIRTTKDYNTLFALFGQTVTHDLGQFLKTPIEVDEELDCCRYARTEDQYPECVPILIQPEDPFYYPQNISCLNVPRAAVCQTCSIGKRIPTSGVSAIFDCSLVYGEIDDRAQDLRRNDGSGKLRTQHTEAGELLPPVAGATRCTREQQGPNAEQQYCFNGGDTRANQHTVLAIFQTIFMREHNRRAEELKILNPHWGEEKLYQEARKILIAEFHVIIYKEYLPILIGKKLMDKYGLNIGGGSNYNSTLNPSLSVEFNAAGFRVHSLVPGKIVDNEDYEYLKYLFVNDIPIYEDRTAPFLSKMSRRPGEKYDSCMPVDLTNWLYREEFGTYGYDLAALDIQRGRDVGLPTYSQMIEYMENRPGTIRTFDDLKQYLVPECLSSLEETYDDARDVDLWMGLNCERIPDDMIISPTAAKIIAEQFNRAKYGDRFYFEHDRTITHGQRKTLLKASLAKLICDNSKVEKIQPKVMFFPSIGNKPRSCSAIPGVDLENWREREERRK